MSSQTTVLFDLDGTVSDGGPGMLGGLVHACRSLDLPVPSEAVLRSFLGPPFQVSFALHFGLDEPACERAVASYREYYYAGGAMLEATPYEGIPRLLRRLGEQGCQLAIATSKPEPFALQAIEHLGLTEHFSGIFGADLEGRATKADVIASACRAIDIDVDRTVMVGDREHDVIGARSNGLECVGVLWGYGTADELAAAGAAAVASSPEVLGRILLDRIATGGG